MAKKPETAAKDPSPTAETQAATPKPIVIEVSAACAHCYFCAQQSMEKGECRRYPPTASVMGGGMQQGQIVSFFPPVDLSSLCGEFVKRQ